MRGVVLSFSIRRVIQGETTQPRDVNGTQVFKKCQRPPHVLECVLPPQWTANTIPESSAQLGKQVEHYEIQTGDRVSDLAKLIKDIPPELRSAAELPSGAVGATSQTISGTLRPPNHGSGGVRQEHCKSEEDQMTRRTVGSLGGLAGQSKGCKSKDKDTTSKDTSTGKTKHTSCKC